MYIVSQRSVPVPSGVIRQAGQDMRVVFPAGTAGFFNNTAKAHTGDGSAFRRPIRTYCRRSPNMICGSMRRPARSPGSSFASAWRSGPRSTATSWRCIPKPAGGYCGFQRRRTEPKGGFLHFKHMDNRYECKTARYVVDSCISKIQRLEISQFASVKGLESVEQHRQIIEACKKKDAEAAARLVEQNWLSLGEILTYETD